MSKAIKSRIGVLVLAVLLSFFMFGCKKDTTPVEDIYFELGDSEQIVLIVGESLDMKDYVVVSPAYATNKKFTISTFDENIISVDNNIVTAVAEGSTQIKVVSKNNDLKEDLMSVVVKKNKTVLNAPTNLKYDNATQCFSFDTVLNAVSYTLNINNQEIDLGNSNIYNLSKFVENSNNTLLDVKVKANAPTYTKAFENSQYTDSLKVYQAGEVKNVSVKNGMLSFEKQDEVLKVNVYINDVLYIENSEDVNFSLKELEEKYSGQTIQIKLEAVVSSNIKEEFGKDVLYFNSSKKLVNVDVLDVPVLRMNSTTISWQNIANAVGYEIYEVLSANSVEKIAQTNDNFYDLKDIIDSSKVYEIKVVPILGSESVNIGQTTKQSTIKVKKLIPTFLVCDGTKIVWDEDENASAYSVLLKWQDSNGEDVSFKTSTGLTYFSMLGYDAGDYVMEVQTVAKEGADANGIFHISSNPAKRTFTKNEVIDANINSYKLNINGLANGEKLLVEFDDDNAAETINGDGSHKHIDFTSTNPDGTLKYQFLEGLRTISLTRLGDSNKDTIDSNKITKTFTQLGPVESMTINGGVLSVEKGDVNQNATIELVTKGTSAGASFVEDGLTVTAETQTYNTTNVGADYLTAGTYTTSAYVKGDGATTFSYRDELGNVAVGSSVNFNVLAIPTISLLDASKEVLTIAEIENALSYNMFRVNGGNMSATKNVSGLEFDFSAHTGFELSDGESQYSVQAKGDEKNYLNSAISNPISVMRLKTPELTYDSETGIVTKTDVNDELLVRGYVFENNGESYEYIKGGANSEYDFGASHNFEQDTTLTLQILANNKVGENYYLNSNIFTLNLSKISNNAVITVDDETNLIIAPVAQDDEYNLEVEFDFGGMSQTFISDDGKLISGGDELTYSYSDGKYIIPLVDGDKIAKLNGFKNGFSVKVKFHKPAGLNENLINSEFTEEKELTIEIDSTTAITTNSSNQIVLGTTHNNAFELTVVIDGVEYVSNGESKLIGGGAELPYTFSSKNYYISVLNDDYTYKISNLNSQLNIKVKYTYYHDKACDLDSSFTPETSLKILEVATISRSGQNLVVSHSNINTTYTYENFALLINGSDPIDLPSNSVKTDGNLTFDIEYVYECIEDYSLFESDINEIYVLTLNTKDINATSSLTSKSDTAYVQKSKGVTLTSNKDNTATNNSVVVSFEILKENYEDNISYVEISQKQYVVTIYTQDNQLKLPRTFTDAEAVDGKISFNLDDYIVLETNTQNKTIYIDVYVKVAASYENTNSIWVFNSNKSEAINFGKIANVEGLSVVDSKLIFNAIDNADFYEIYEFALGSYTKIGHTNTTEFVFSNISDDQSKVIVVKAISEIDGYTNSSYSNGITINKPTEPIVTTQGGRFNIELPENISDLIETDGLAITLNVINKQNGNVAKTADIDINADAKLNGTILTVEPSELLTYSGNSLIAEDLSIQLKFDYSEALNGVYYLNTDVVEFLAYGMVKPTQVEKTVDNDSVEIIKWTPSQYNVLVGSTISVGYVVKFEYTNLNGETKPYYTNDENLKYFNSESGNYEKYYTGNHKLVVGESVFFPAGYDEGNNGSLDIKFEAGSYKISVQTVPITTIVGYNLCSSNFTDVYEFEILAKTELSMSNGKVVWDAQSGAGNYTVTVHRVDGTKEDVIDVVKGTEYGFTNPIFNELSGVYSVVVKANGTNKSVNGQVSDPIYVYRLPQAEAAYIDDGQLIISATQFFTTAVVEFEDANNSVVCYEEYENTLAETNLDGLQISSWDGFNAHSTINATKEYVFNLSGDSLSVLDGGDYIINIRLIGNSNNDLGLIDSSTVQALSTLTATKLKPSTTTIGLGVVEFGADTDYKKFTNGKYTGENFNYSFNGETSSVFWNNTIVYKIQIAYGNGIAEFYAVDYDCFEAAKANNLITASEYLEISNSNDLCAVVYYPYAEGTKTIYFNVYKDNIINLKDYDNLRYYYIEEKIINGETKTSSYIDLASGGSFTISITLMGGDSYEKSPNNKVGHLTASTANIKTFVRYSTNQISTDKGKVQFYNLLPIVNGVAIDNPVYKIVVTDVSGNNPKVFYLYHSDYDSAEQVALKDDVHANLDNIIQVEIDPKNVDLLYFDLSQYVEHGTYKATIRTLAGLGSGSDDAKYLLSAKVTNDPATLYKYSDTYFSSYYRDEDTKGWNGNLTFAQSYISQDDGNAYCEKYEITIYDNDEDVYAVYEIDANSEGVTIDKNNHVVIYSIPAKITCVVMYKDSIDGRNELELTANGKYQIKVRAKSTAKPVLNGTYAKDAADDKLFNFQKRKGITNLRVDEGMLKWKVEDDIDKVVTMLKLTYTDKSVEKNIFIKVTNDNKFVSNGAYQYHYYTFSNTQYDEIIASGVNYTITAYTTNIDSVVDTYINSNMASKITKTRLNSVDQSSIKTTNGNLTWSSVDRAVSYDVVFTGSDTFKFTSHSTQFVDVDNQLPAGWYDVQIRANGSDLFTSMGTSGANRFMKLPGVDINSISIDHNTISWTPVVWDEVVWSDKTQAEAYIIQIDYTDGDGEKTSISEKVNKCLYTFLPENGIQDTFTIKITAVGDDGGMFINSNTVERKVSTAVPDAIDSLVFDEVNKKLLVTVGANKLLPGDVIGISYQFVQYLSTGSVDMGHKTVEINYQEGVTQYEYQLTVIGEYSSVYAQVYRNGTIPSGTVTMGDVTFDMFSYGSGTSGDPYTIANEQQLLNIKHYPSAHFKLISNINLNNINIAEELSGKNALICETFTGVFDGNEHAILDFAESNDKEVELNGVESFALFKTIEGATFKNLLFGVEDNQLILSNTFANNLPNMIELSLIATDAINATIENIDANVAIKLSSTVKVESTEKLAEMTGESIHVGGLFGTISNESTISGSTINISVEIDMPFAGIVDVQIGGFAREIVSSNVESTNINFNVTTDGKNVLDCVGGVAARITSGSTISGTNVVFETAESSAITVKAGYIGGLAGYADSSTIDESEATMKYSVSDISYNTYVGGLVGCAINATIQDSGAIVTFDLTIANSSNTTRFGAIVGYIEALDVDGSIGYAKIYKCYSNVYDETKQNKETTIGVDLKVVVGMYGKTLGEVAIGELTTNKQEQ